MKLPSHETRRRWFDAVLTEAAAAFPRAHGKKRAPVFRQRRALFASHTLFQEAPPLTSVISTPWAFSSSRMRSASAKFFAFLAS